MLRLHGIIGHEGDAAVSERLHRLRHDDAVEHLAVPEADAARRRLRLTTDRGTDCALSLGREESLVDGAVLLLESHRAIVVRLGLPRLLRLRPRHLEAALRLGWSAGHLHWRVRFEGHDLVVPLDAPEADYRARIADLLDDGSVSVVDDG